MIPWRKLQAGLSGKGDAQDVIGAIEHVSGNASTDVLTSYDKLTVKRLTVVNRLTIPNGSDKFETTSGPVISQDKYITGGDYNVGRHTTNWGAQTFTSDSNYVASSVKLYAAQSNCTTGDICYVGIYAVDGSSQPTGTVLSSWATLPFNDFGSFDDFYWEEFAFTTKPTINSGQEYAIVFRTNTPNATRQFFFKADNGDSTYTSGLSWVSANSGSTWTSGGANTDFLFEVLGNAQNTAPSQYWTEDNNLHGIDGSSTERVYIHTADVDDSPVNGATTAPISSNWAYDHVADSDPHVGYVLESLYGTSSIVRSQGSAGVVSNLIVDEQRLVGRLTSGSISALNGSQTLGILSGQAGTAFDFGSQSITGIGGFTILGGANILIGTTTGTKIATTTSQLLGFYGVTPVDQPGTVIDPTGGLVVDAECRTAVIALIDRLQELGLMA